MPTVSDLNLNKRIIIRKIDSNHIAIVKLIKSRIISKDARKVAEIALQIREQNPGTKISLICTTNICSKSKEVLMEHDIDIFYEELN